jgi:methylphosphotriester-DNA--protein-cysteine methyltransferase
MSVPPHAPALSITPPAAAIEKNRIERARPVHREIAWAISELERTRGGARSGELAEQLGRSRKHLRQGFLDQVGMAAKQLAQLLRFNHVVERLQALTPDSPEHDSIRFESVRHFH